MNNQEIATIDIQAWDANKSYTVSEAAGIVLVFCRMLDAERKGRGKVRGPNAHHELLACRAWAYLCDVACYSPRMPRTVQAYDDAMGHISFQESPIGAWLADLGKQ